MPTRMRTRLAPASPPPIRAIGSTPDGIEAFDDLRPPGRVEIDATAGVVSIHTTGPVSFKLLRHVAAGRAQPSTPAQTGDSRVQQPTLSSVGELPMLAA